MEIECASSRLPPVTLQKMPPPRESPDLVGVCLPTRADIATEDYVGIPNRQGAGVGRVSARPKPRESSQMIARHHLGDAGAGDEKGKPEGRHKRACSVESTTANDEWFCSVTTPRLSRPHSLRFCTCRNRGN